MKYAVLFCLLLVSGLTFAEDPEISSNEMVKLYNDPRPNMPEKENDRRKFQLFRRIADHWQRNGKESFDVAVEHTFKLTGSTEHRDLYIATYKKTMLAKADAAKAEATKETVKPASASPFDAAKAPTATPVPEPDPTLLAWREEMRRCLKSASIPKAKAVAKRIIVNYPGTPEAEEATGVLQIK